MLSFPHLQFHCPELLLPSCFFSLHSDPKSGKMAEMWPLYLMEPQCPLPSEAHTACEKFSLNVCKSISLSHCNFLWILAESYSATWTTTFFSCYANVLAVQLNLCHDHNNKHHSSSSWWCSPFVGTCPCLLGSLQAPQIRSVFLVLCCISP